MSALIEHIKAVNAKAKAWEAEAPGRCAGLLLEDEKWWNETRDVYTVLQFKRWEMEAVMSDMAKEAYGSRSACPNTSLMTFDELEGAYNELLNAVDVAAEAEQAEQLLAVTEFEATIVKLIEAGAKDRDTAITWLRLSERSEHAQHDDNYFEYSYNLPYGYLAGALKA